MNVVTAEPKFGFGVKFEDLYSRDGLIKTDSAFLAFLAEADSALRDRLAAARDVPPADVRDEADLLMEVAPHVEDFLARLFDIKAETAALAERISALSPLYACKRLFVQRRAAKAATPDQAAAFDGDALTADLTALFGGAWDELIYARHVMGWLEDEAANAGKLAAAQAYASWALYAPAGKARHHAGILFKQPVRHDPAHLIDVETEEANGVTKYKLGEAHQRHREGFALTDSGTDLKGALDQVNYCIFCHHQKKDSCSKGVIDKKTGAFAKNALGTVAAGCPLEERISEMHEAKSQGYSVAGLAFAIIDNPMIAGTGHRICNDCMIGCIYSVGGRDPVNVPEAESRILKDVLELPWGFEIYSLLTRWNPLSLRRPVPKAPTGRTVLVAGLGPAGYTLAHHLMNDGHAVVAIDGLKIEPLDRAISGVTPDGERVPFRAIRDIAELKEPLDARVMAGFGGVAEYGITVRWDKNFLKLIRLILERRSEFAMIGGVRLGGTLTLDQAFEMGFDHVALAMGAGRPTVIDMPNNLAPGVRQASDFLMALQLTGAARKDSIANLQIRLPVVVIGGGLTAVDTATEVLAYYPVQVEKFLSRWELLVRDRGEEIVRAGFSDFDIEVAEEFLAHGRTIRAERAAAEAEGRAPNIVKLLQSWGGATIAYRRKMIESPAYTRNHEEVAKALEEGIRFAELLTPVAVEVNEMGAAKALRVKKADGSEATLPARAILVAAGTVPNTVLTREIPGISMEGRYFQAVDEDGNPVKPEMLTKPASVQVLMTYDKADKAGEPDGSGRHAVSFFGDLHPSFAGNVVSAMASAKQGYPMITRALSRAPASLFSPAEIFARVNEELRAKVAWVERLTPNIVEVVVHSPATARAFKPGQFFRLQNFETLAPRTGDTVFAMEGLALTGAWVDPARGLISIIVLEMGGSSDLCALLKPDEPVVLMGPTGTPTEIFSGETTLLAGGGLGNAVLFSIGKALREAGSRVLYFAGYKDAADRYKISEIEAAADTVVWCVDGGRPLAPGRPGDLTFVGNIVQAMRAYGEGWLGRPPIPLPEVDRIIAIGSDGMMRAVANARHNELAPFLNPRHTAIGSINSPMQCMMKEICAQCLQKLKDPVTGEERVVFICANQDQPLDQVDFPGLKGRLSQNGVEEKLNRLWVDRGLRKLGLRG
jgi:NADPH-dependent glutamate synthase beta subunit-like oxidoreductase/NAD(P)H-flavin reductase